MTGRDPCERYASSIVDPAVSRPADLEAHLAACPACRSLDAAHRAASRLRAAPAAGAPPWPLEAIVARVRRRRLARGVAVLGAASLAALALGIVRSRPPPAPGGDLFAVAEVVAGYVERDVARADPALGSLAPIAGWFAAPPRQPFEPSPFAPSRRAAGGDPP
jgi:hypothetical protein